MKVILASGSPRRQELLHLVTDDFTVCPVDADETLPEGLPIEMAAAYLADLKAKSGALLFPQDVVIGCDTVVVFEDEIMGKPKDRADAARMLRRLSGETHTVMTGVSLYLGSQTTVFTTETQVTFYPLTDAEIETYLLVRELHGDYYNVVGLPVAPLARMLQKFIKTVAHPRVRFKRPGEGTEQKD